MEINKNENEPTKRNEMKKEDMRASPHRGHGHCILYIRCPHTHIRIRIDKFFWSFEVNYIF